MSAIQIELPEQVHQRAIELARQNSMPPDRLILIALVEKLFTMFPTRCSKDAPSVEFVNRSVYPCASVVSFLSTAEFRLGAEARNK